MTDAVKNAIREVMDAFNGFQARQAARLSEQDKRMDDLEIVLNRPGAPASRSMQAPVASDDDWQAPGGGTVRVMRGPADFRAHYLAQPPAEGTEGVTLAAFLRGAAGMSTTSAARAALSTGTGSEGGFAVPDSVMAGILEAMAPASSLLRAGAGVVPLEVGAKSYVTAAVATIPTASWRLEHGDISQSSPAFRSVVAQPQSLSFYFKTSRELLADAPNIEAALRTVIAQAFAKELDRAGLRGSGLEPEPRGILNTPGVQSVTNGIDGAPLTWANFFSAIEKILESDGPMPTAAIMSPRSLVKLGCV